MFPKASKRPSITSALIISVCLKVIVPLSTNGQDTQNSTPGNNPVMTWMSQHISGFPKEVTVTNSVQATIINPNQVEIGSINISSGTTVQVTQITPDILQVRMGELNLKIPTVSTDFIVRATTTSPSMTTNSQVRANSTAATDKPTSAQVSRPELLLQPSVTKTTLLGMGLEPVGIRYLRLLKKIANAPDSGALVSYIFPNSPAINGQLENGSIITKYNDQDVNSVGELVKMIYSSEVGSSARLESYSLRGGPKKSSITIDFTSSQPNSDAVASSKLAMLQINRPWLGVGLAELGELNSVAEKINMPADLNAPKYGSGSDGGALIINVYPDSPAARALLEPGTVITEFNGVFVKDHCALTDKISSSKIGTTVKLKIWIPDVGWTEKSVVLDARPAWKPFPTATRPANVTAAAVTSPPSSADTNSASAGGVSVNSSTAPSGVGTINTSTSLSDADFSTPELISAAFLKNPTASEEYLKSRQINVYGRVKKFKMMDVSQYVIGLVMTLDQKPDVIFIDDAKKPYGLIDKTIHQDNSNGDDTAGTVDINNTWQVNGSELILHSEWNEADPDWSKHPRAYQANYPIGYVPKTPRHKDSSVIGIGEDRGTSVRFLKYNATAVYFEIVK